MIDTTAPRGFARTSRRIAAVGCLAVLSALGWAGLRFGGPASSPGPTPVTGAPVFADPLDTPAAAIGDAGKAATTALAQAGERIIAVGLRGAIFASEDQGRSWKQIASPVGSDLTAVMFPTPQQGWIVGHEGVVLHSGDGGLSWRKQLDGRIAATTLVAHYQQRIAAGETGLDHPLRALQQNYAAGPAYPYLDVWFDNEREGWAVGSFGLLIATRDGGDSWQPWLDHIDNGNQYNLNAIRKIGAELYIAGERGLVFRLNRATQRFDSVATDYKGSFFGIAGTADALLAFGLRGSAYRSGDRGVSWTRVEMPSGVELTAGALLPDDGRMVVGDAAGQVFVERGGSFQAAASAGVTLTGLLPQPGGSLLLTSLQGLRQVRWDAGPLSLAERGATQARQIP